MNMPKAFDQGYPDASFSIIERDNYLVQNRLNNIKLLSIFQGVETPTVQLFREKAKQLETRCYLYNLSLTGVVHVDENYCVFLKKAEHCTIKFIWLRQMTLWRLGQIISTNVHNFSHILSDSWDWPMSLFSGFATDIVYKILTQSYDDWRN